MKKTIRIATLSAIIAVAIAGIALPASASSTDSISAPQGQTTSVTTGADPACVAAVTAAIAQGKQGLSTEVCAFTQEVTISASKRVTVADVQAARSSLSASDFQALQAAAAAGAVQSKTFRRTYDNVVVAWSQSGKFYFDGSRAWVGTAYRGYTGYKSCTVDRAIGYIIEVKKCDESGSTATRNLRAIFHTSVVPSAGIVNWDTEWHTYVNSAGSVWW